MHYVIKRNGNKEEFNSGKIEAAILKAFDSCSYKLSEKDRKNITSFLNELENEDVAEDKEYSVEYIQDRVEKFLCKRWFRVGKAYMLYREQHKTGRFIRERLDYMKKYSDSNTNASSASETDSNANVTMKNVANLEGEVYKTTNRIIQRQRMKAKLKELYPEVAEQYEKDLENHIIYTHDEASTPVLKYYCCAVTLYPLMTEGVGNIDGITPTPPNDIQSFSGQITNLAFLLSSQCKGAVAFGDYFVALNYYVVKEFGDHWYDKVDVIITNSHIQKQQTIEHCILKGMKQFIYGVCQPAGNRSYNSPFTNVSWYDKYYFEAMFGDFYYPDGTKPEWKAVDKLQRMFMKLMREIRLLTPITFPVTTMSLLHNGKEFLDKDYEDLCAEEWSKGGSFFCYMNDNPASLASCCFSKDTKFLWKASTSGVHINTFEEFLNLSYKGVKENFKVFHNGSWIAGKVVEVKNRPMYKVITYNNKEFIMSDNHINVTYNGEKTTRELTTEDYLMFNTSALCEVPEVSENLTYEQGFVIGSFLGDGSLGATIKDTIYQLEVSQNEEKYKKTMGLFNIANKQLGNSNECTLKSIVNNKYPVSLCSKELVTFIIKWTNWQRGITAPSKELNMNCLLQSIEFRKGILDGWYHTDGGNSNRCYSTSKKLIECMEVLCTSLGLQTIIDISDRTDESVVIRGEEYNRNYPLYCLRWYVEANHRCNKTKDKSWKKKNNSIFWKIKSIEPIDYKNNIYCVQCENQDEPYFTLPCGLITHNCRVLNEMSDNTFSSTTGMNGVMTGSCNVITLNLNRITQDYFKTVDTNYFGATGILYQDVTEEDMQGFKEYLISILDRVYKYHIAYKTMLYEMEGKGMFAASNGNYIYMKKLYSTIGLIGYMEAAEFLGLKINNNEEYKNFLKLIFSTVSEQNKLHSIHDKKKPFLMNSEAIPGENLGVKLLEWDKKDGYWTPEGAKRYNCYFFNPWNDKVSILDKIKLHGGDIAKALSGGQAAHLNLDTHLSKEQYKQLMHVAMKNGTNYFTFNIPMSKCKDCNHVVNAPVTECPTCHSTNIKYYTRIIGYLSAVDNWSEAMQKEFGDRYFSDEKHVGLD